MEAAFLAAHLLAIAGWLALLAAPWLGTGAAVRTARAVAILLCILYAGGLALHLGDLPRGQGFSLASVGSAFAVPALALVFWVHYLAFDLWVGSWEAEDAAARGVGHARLVPALLLTFMIGPLGLLLYLALRGGRRAGR